MASPRGFNSSRKRKLIAETFISLITTLCYFSLQVSIGWLKKSFNQKSFNHCPRFSDRTKTVVRFNGRRDDFSQFF